MSRDKGAVSLSRLRQSLEGGSLPSRGVSLRVCLGSAILRRRPLRPVSGSVLRLMAPGRLQMTLQSTRTLGLWILGGGV